MEVLAPPPSDPLIRTEPPFDWYRTPSEARPRTAPAGLLPDLDPDIALWPVTPVNRWPFAGAPTEGIWPKGWMGVDNTGTAYVCTVGGEPGTWVAIGAGGIASWGQTSTAKFAGSGSPVGVVTPSGEGDLYVDDTTPGLWQATGATSADWAQVGTSGQLPNYTSPGAGITITDTSPDGITVNEAGTSGVTIETTGGGATTGVTIETQATDTTGIFLQDSGPNGINLAVNGAGQIGIGTTGLAAGGLNVSIEAGGIQLNEGAAGGASGISVLEGGAAGISLSTVGGLASTGIAMTTQATDTTGIILTNNSAAGTITLDAVAGLIKLLGVPTSDPGVSGALYTTAGVLHISP